MDLFSRKKRKIIVIDDSEDQLYLTSTTLNKKTDYEVEIMLVNNESMLDFLDKNKKENLKKIKDSSTILIITDYEMGKFRGDELIEELITQHKVSSPILCNTSNGIETARKLYALNEKYKNKIGYMQKPFSFEILKDLFKELFDK